MQISALGRNSHHPYPPIVALEAQMTTKDGRQHPRTELAYYASLLYGLILLEQACGPMTTSPLSAKVQNHVQRSVAIRVVILVIPVSQPRSSSPLRLLVVPSRLKLGSKDYTVLSKRFPCIEKGARVSNASEAPISPSCCQYVRSANRTITHVQLQFFERNRCPRTCLAASLHAAVFHVKSQKVKR